MTVAEKMAQSAVVFANNAKTNATMMKGTAQVFIFTLAFFAHIYPAVAPEVLEEKPVGIFSLKL